MAFVQKNRMATVHKRPSSLSSSSLSSSSLSRRRYTCSATTSVFVSRAGRRRRRCARRWCAGDGGGGGGGDADDLDWEGDAGRNLGGETGRRRGGERAAAAGSGFARAALPGGPEPRQGRRPGAEYAKTMPLPSSPWTSTPEGRRNAIAVLTAGIAGVGFLSSTFLGDRFGSGYTSGESPELDLYVSKDGVIFGRTSFGDFVEFLNDGKGNPVVRDQRGNMFQYEKDIPEDNLYMELVDRNGNVVVVPPRYVKKICMSSRTVTDDVLKQSTGDLEVEPAPVSISSYAENGGTPLPVEDVIERRMKIESLMDEIDEAAADVAAAEAKKAKKKKKKK